MNDVLEALLAMSEALTKRQSLDRDDPDFGGIYCARCGCYHIRAAEALFPWTVAFLHTEQRRFLEGAIHLGNWLVSRQQPGGVWFETRAELPATTVFQLMAVAAAYPSIESHLSQGTREIWQDSIARAAAWTCETMAESFANVNYCASSAAALMLAFRTIPERRFKEAARRLAYGVLDRIDGQGLLWGEGPAYYRGIGRFVGRGGVDVAYNLDMSLGALALYSTLSGDSQVRAATIRALKAHLSFIYPDGSVDDSWGSRSYKWTLYGSLTAHGAQMGLNLLSGEDPAIESASRLNFSYLKDMMCEGVVGYGPHSWWNRTFEPCIYPTFARAAGLAFALHYAPEKGVGFAAPFGRADTHEVRLYKALNVCLVTTAGLKATITGHKPGFMRCNDLANLLLWFRQSLHRIVPMRSFGSRPTVPTGGALSYLWVQGCGAVQVSSQTRYTAVEPMHMPAIEGTETLTPHVRVLVGNRVYTNLHDFAARISVKQQGNPCRVTCSGKLKDEGFKECGIRFRYDYEFDLRSVTKTLTLQGRGQQARVEIIEPIIWDRDMQIESLENGLVLRSASRVCEFRLLTSGAQLVHGQDAGRYWSLFPHLYAYPIKLVISDLAILPVVVRYRVGLAAMPGADSEDLP